MKVEKITEEEISVFFEQNDDIRLKYTNCLSGIKKFLKEKGGMEELIMFLSGMGGTGKSEVIKAFVQFAKRISSAFGWKYDNDVVKITALTGSAACEIPNGKTLHSQACLSHRKISLKLKETWKSTKMIIIDEVSFLDEDNIRKLDKHMRKLKEDDSMYGGVHIVFVGDFFKYYQLENHHYSRVIHCNSMQLTELFS